VQHLSLTQHERHGLPVFEVPDMRAVGVDVWITTRGGGVSSAPYASLNLGDHVGDDLDAVAENRRRLAAGVRVVPDHLIFTQQVHGAQVNYVEGPGEHFIGDALVSEQSDMALAILGADCLGVVMADAFSSTFAVCHAGWRGLREGVLAHTLAAFRDPATVHVFIGPGISGESYEVGPEVAEHFAVITGALRPRGDRFLLDLNVVAEHQLRSRGVPASQIFTSGLHTDGGTTFFSDRAERPCGRFAVVARRATYDEHVENH